jgi:multidrug efflux pump
MSISTPFIKRPVATTLLAVGLAISGIVAFKFLPVSALPQIEFPTISVQASLPGASPEIMASSIATPLERQIGHIAGITEITSSSTLGSTRITVQFDLTRNIDGAARDVQAAINASRSQLPIDLPSQPTYRKVNPADAPVMILALTSSIYSTGEMYDAASTILAQKLSQVEGIGQVIVGGSSLPAVRVELNPNIINKYGIGLEDIRASLQASNANRPKGQLSNGIQTAEIITNDQIFKAIDYQPLIISYKNGAPVRLSDVAEVTDSVEDLRNAGLANGKPAVVIILFKQPGANVIETVDNIKEIIPVLQGSIPAKMDMAIMMDRTTTIRASLRDVEATLIIAIILVVWVIYVFLRNARAALIPSITVPLSLLGTFGVMYLLGFTLDNLSLMALTIATGFVVDDAVVVLENISRHIEAGMKPLNAAIIGAKEVGFTVLSMSFSLIAVFIPILLMSGIVGRLFREFALTMSIAILISLMISLTVTPMMCAMLLKSKTKEQQEKVHKYYIFQIRDHYAKSLQWALNHPKVMLTLMLITLVINIFLFYIVPRGFFPQQDTGRVMGSIQAQQNISFQAMKEKLSAFVKIVGEDPAVESVIAFVGGGNKTSNAGNMYISLKPLSTRKISSEEVISRLRNRLNEVPAANLYLTSAQDLVIGGRQSNAQYVYSLTSFDLDTLNAWVPKIMSKFATLPGLVDLNNDQLNAGLQSYVKVDRDTASRFGITSEEIDNTLYDAFGQRQVSVMYTTMNQYHVVMEVAPQYWQRPETLKDIYINSSTGVKVPLATFANFSQSSTLLQVSHQGQFPAATLSFNLPPGIALGNAVDLINNAVEELQFSEGTISGSFQGTAQAFQASLASEPYLILAALMAVYIVLGMLYESTIHPITIISTLPSAGVGALLALLITNTQLSLIALIGIILLIGIVKKNAIMMIDFALALERNENKSSKEAIYEACILRFRPIMMTTMAALLSATPLAFGTGVGSELRRPLGIAIIGGLIFSQMLTLYTTPVIYLEFENLALWIKKKWKKFFPDREPQLPIEVMPR